MRADGSEVVLANVLANEFLQPLDGPELRLLALLPEPLQVWEFAGILDELVVPPHGIQTLAQVVNHVVIVVPDRLGLANEIVLLSVLFVHGESPFSGENRGQDPTFYRSSCPSAAMRPPVTFNTNLGRGSLVQA